MRIVDELVIKATAARVFDLAADVEAWPQILPHYRWVRILEGGKSSGPTVVEMAAWRPFGPVGWPTWWVSEMWVDRDRREVRYKHVRGITRGMDVVWQVKAQGQSAHASIVHEWDGPGWPLVNRPAAEWVIGPVFVHGIASRTLAGIGRAAEAGHA
jgi:ribosome-associated toxin RatA of RatAB toxin-antitoxin module